MSIIGSDNDNENLLIEVNSSLLSFSYLLASLAEFVPIAWDSFCLPMVNKVLGGEYVRRHLASALHRVKIHLCVLYDQFDLNLGLIIISIGSGKQNHPGDLY